MANERLDWLRQQREAKFSKPAVKEAPVAPAQRVRSTEPRQRTSAEPVARPLPSYQYRDPDKRRAYMAELMRKKRKARRDAG